MSGRTLRLARAVALIDAREPEGDCLPGAENGDLDLKAEDLANRLEEAVAAIGDCVAILKELGMDAGKAGDKILSIVRDEALGPERIPGGFSEGKPDSEFDPDQLEKGIRVELEHTGDIGVAKEIAKDHLTEMPCDYYDRLEEMEEEAEKAGKTNRLADETP